jgi:hypothetical protein
MPKRFDRHDLALGIAQCCELATETQPVSMLTVLLRKSGSGTYSYERGDSEPIRLVVISLG